VGSRSGPGQEPDGRRDGMVGGRDLPVAIAVGVVLATLFLASLFWPPLACTVVVAALTAVAYVEVERVLQATGVRLLTWVLIGSTVAMLAGAYVAGPAGQSLGVMVLVLGAITWVLADRGRIRIIQTLGTTVLFGLWVGFLASYTVLLVDRPSGAIVVLGVIGAPIFTDIGGYAFGVTFGRHKVAPSISPNKSWEGLIGGVVLATALGAGVLPLFGDAFTPLSGAVLAAACGLVSFLGDLAESMLKRELGVKDLGDFLPGHGGVLDRVDGILFALPVGYYVMAALG
jgi:phosphatidate cytidylyltransferase